MISIILVKARDTNNIGAAARAMVNFGITDLRLVDIYEPTLRESVAAVGAQEILKKAKIYTTLEDALADCNYAYALTSLKNRNQDSPVVALPDLAGALAGGPQGRTAFVFGSEKTGLSNEHIALCDAVLTIPTDAKQPSINLAQSVILTAYELSRTKIKPPQTQQDPPPTKSDIEIVSKEIYRAADKYNFLPENTDQGRLNIVRSILSRSALSKKQLFFIKKFVNLIK